MINFIKCPDITNTFTVNSCQIIMVKYTKAILYNIIYKWNMGSFILEMFICIL